jgi:hypothetical protein
VWHFPAALALLSNAANSWQNEYAKVAPIENLSFHDVKNKTTSKSNFYCQ